MPIHLSCGAKEIVQPKMSVYCHSLLYTNIKILAHTDKADNYFHGIIDNW